MFLHIKIGLLIQQISLIIFELLINISPKLRFLRFPHQFLMQCQCVIDSCDVFEVDCVGYLQTFHAVCVTPFLEVHLEGTAAPVTVVAADLTFVLDSQSVKLVQPIGNGFSIPA